MARNKFNARKTQRCGIWFDSRKEAEAYVALRQLEREGRISELECQPNYELQSAFMDSSGKRVQAISYTPDFRYYDVLADETVVVEVKSSATKTQASMLRIKLFKFRYRDVRFEIWE